MRWLNEIRSLREACWQPWRTNSLRARQEVASFFYKAASCVSFYWQSPAVCQDTLNSERTEFRQMISSGPHTANICNKTVRFKSILGICMSITSQNMKHLSDIRTHFCAVSLWFTAAVLLSNLKLHKSVASASVLLNQRNRKHKTRKGSLFHRAHDWCKHTNWALNRQKHHTDTLYQSKTSDRSSCQ